MTLDTTKLRERVERYARDDADGDLDSEKWGEAVPPLDVLAILTERDTLRATVERLTREREEGKDLASTIIAVARQERDVAIRERDATRERVDISEKHTKMFARAADTEKAEAKHWRERAELAEAKLAEPEGASRDATDDTSRCAVCGWPLGDPDAWPKAWGCKRGDCSQRPRPERLYAPERATKEQP